MSFDAIIIGTVGYLMQVFMFWFVFTIAKQASKEGQEKRFWIYLKALGISLFIAFFSYALNDGTVSECDDPLYGSCDVVDQSEVDPIKRKESAAIVFLVVAFASFTGIASAERKPKNERGDSTR